MWRKGFRKKKPYTADELRAIPCERVTQQILRCLGEGRILQIAPPFEDLGMTIGPVHPPGGGTISDWYYHRVVQIGDKVYDLMTGPSGMPLEQYLQFFEERDALVIRPLVEKV